MERNGRVPRSEAPPKDSPFRDLVNLLRRNMRIILACTALSGGATAYYVWTVRPVYEAAATIHVDASRPITQEFAFIAEMLRAGDVDTEMALLGARSLAEAAVDSLALQIVFEKPSDSGRDDVFSQVSAGRATVAERYDFRRDGEEAGAPYVIVDSEGREVGRIAQGEAMVFNGARIVLADGEAAEGVQDQDAGGAGSRRILGGGAGRRATHPRGGGDVRVVPGDGPGAGGKGSEPGRFALPGEAQPGQATGGRLHRGLPRTADTGARRQLAPGGRGSAQVSAGRAGRGLGGGRGGASAVARRRAGREAQARGRAGVADRSAGRHRGARGRDPPGSRGEVALPGAGGLCHVPREPSRHRVAVGTQSDRDRPHRPSWSCARRPTPKWWRWTRRSLSWKASSTSSR